MKSPADPPSLANGGAAADKVRDAPAFDFYPERWLVGVAGMSDAEQLAYLRLLCHQWLLGDAGLPPDVPALKRLGGSKGVTPAVLAKLPEGEDGRRRNARLEVIRGEQRVRIAKKSEQRRAAANKRWHGTAETPPANGRRTRGGGTCETDAAGMRPPFEAPCETDAEDMRPHCESMCETDAAGMPTTHHPPPTTHPVPEDANDAGARVREAAAAHAAEEQAAWDAAAEEAAAREAADAAADAAAAAERAAEARAAAARPADGAAAYATPSLATVQAWAVKIGCPPDKAEIWWCEHEARPFTIHGRWTDRDGNAVQSPQHALTAWWRKWEANDHQRSTRLNPPTTAYHGTPRTAAVRSDSANAPGRYA